MNTSLEDPSPIGITGWYTLHVLGKARFFSQCVDIDGVEVVSAIIPALDFIGLIEICLSGEVPGVGRRVNNASSLIDVSLDLSTHR